MYFTSTNDFIWNFAILQFCSLNFFESRLFWTLFHFLKFSELTTTRASPPWTSASPAPPWKKTGPWQKNWRKLCPKKILTKKNCLSPQNILQPATQQQRKSHLGKILCWGRQIIQSPLWETVPEVRKRLWEGSIWWECMKYLEAVSPSMRYTQSSCKTAQTYGRTIKPIIKSLILFL